MSRAYLYIRWSSKGKQDRGDSRARQEAGGRALIEKEGWTLVGEPFGDFGVSAWKGDNQSTGNLGRFTEQVRSGQIEPGSILVCEKLDRLSRTDMYETQDWLREMTRLGLRIATYMDGRVYDAHSFSNSNSEQLLIAMQVLMEARAANILSETISERVKGAWVSNRKKAAETGRVISAHAPGWLRTVGEGDSRRFEWIPERVETVRKIYQWSADGMGAASIARKLNQNGIAPWGRAYHHERSKAVGWEHTYVSDILASSAVEGDLEPGVGRRRNREKTGERIEGYFGKPVVDADLVKRARSAIKARKGTGGNGQEQVRNLFVGLVRCGHCDSAMTLVGNSAKPARYLLCINASRGRGCIQKKTFGYIPFEKAALDQILELALDEKFFEQPDETQAVRIEIANVEKAISIKQAAADNLAQALAAGFTAAIHQQAMKVDADIETLKRQLSGLHNALRLAQRQVSRQEHLQRVLTVRDALAADDYETRLTARRRVATALRSIDVKVVCRIADDGCKELLLTVLGKAAVFLFNNAGSLLGKADAWEFFSEHVKAMNDDELTDLNTKLASLPGVETMPPEQREKIEAYFRRRAS